MKRVLLTVAYLSWAGLVGSSIAQAQDRISYYDRVAKKEATLPVTIDQESAGGIVYKPTIGTGTKEISATDIFDVFYQVRPALRPDYQGAVAKERAVDKATDANRKKALAEALKEYESLLPKLADAKLAHRHTQFKIAQLMARRAEDDPAQATAAIDALLKFRKDHADSWQISSCTKLLARLQMDKGDFDGAQKTYEDLAKTANLPKEVRQEAELLSAQVLTRAKKYPEAEKRLQQALQTFSPDDPQALRVRVYLAECQAANNQLPAAVKQLEDVIAKTADGNLKALAHNTLGDCYLASNRPNDAKWEYLMVDVIYHQDRQEHARAMQQLAKVFDQIKDEARAKQYRERLQKGK